MREGAELVRRPFDTAPGRFALMAAIAAVHSGAPTWDDTDSHEVVGLYDVLVQIWPSPVVALNRAVAVGFEQGPEAGLAALEPLTAEPQPPAMATWPPLARTSCGDSDATSKLGTHTRRRCC